MSYIHNANQATSGHKYCIYLQQLKDSVQYTTALAMTSLHDICIPVTTADSTAGVN